MGGEMSPVDANRWGARAPLPLLACLYKTECQVTIKACGACDWVTLASLRPVRREATQCKKNRKENFNDDSIHPHSTLLCDFIDIHSKITKEEKTKATTERRCEFLIFFFSPFEFT